ncbi:MAG: HAMP domain-containing histidine kinase [Clostridia bacterium]|nr:HAMP domain-containing histidine kinase [Clostridia bacterium]
MKKKSIYFQLFTLVMSIFLISILLTGTLLFGFLGSYFTQTNEKKLTDIAQQVVDNTLVLAENGQAVSYGAYVKDLETIAATTGTQVFVFDHEAKVIASSIKGYGGELKETFTNSILEGEAKTFKGSISMGSRVSMLAVGRPIKYADSIVGGVLVSIPMPQVSQARSEIIGIFLRNMIIVTLFAALMVYFVAKKISKPITQLNEAAKSIATGNFNQRVEVEDTGEIGELGETFNYMAESIEQFENTRNSFLANVSHDLRTPMTTITGFVQGILDGTIPEEKRDWYLSIVLDESKRLSRIVNDLFDISKLEQGKFNLELREFDINELTRLNIIKFEKRITDKNIQLSVEFERDNLMVSADRDAISRVMMNLFDNAIKFTNEKGFIHIRVGTKNGKAFVSVENSGMGIAEEELLHIFDRFYKTDKSRSLDKNGAGLGLYIVKNIIQAHGERVWAESKQGEFARFSFTLKKTDNKKQIEG